MIPDSCHQQLAQIPGHHADKDWPALASYKHANATILTLCRVEYLTLMPLR